MQGLHSFLLELGTVLDTIGGDWSYLRLVMDEKRIQTPLTDAAVRDLRAGDAVLISGPVLAARDQAHKRLCALIEGGQPLPVELQGALIYYVGPTPPRAPTGPEPWPPPGPGFWR